MCKVASVQSIQFYSVFYIKNRFQTKDAAKQCVERVESFTIIKILLAKEWPE